MFSEILNDISRKRIENNANKDRLKREVSNACADFVDETFSTLNTGVAKAYVNQKKINSEIKMMSTQINEYNKQVTTWFQLVDNFNTALKELGDVQNWTLAMQRDMKTIHDTLAAVDSSPVSNPSTSK